MKQLFLYLFLLCISGCVTTQAPQGIDNSIYSRTKIKKVTSNIDGVNKQLSFVEGPVVQIDSNQINRFSLIKFKDGKGEIRYRIIYQQIGLLAESAVETITNTSLSIDGLSQDDVNGYVLESAALDVERYLLDKCLESGMKIVLYSKGNGTVMTPTPEMKKAMSREDWDTVKKLMESGHGNQSKYDNRSATINIPPAYLKAFLAKSDLIEL